MKETRNFLLLAVGVGVVGILLGVMVIWNAVTDILNP